MKRSLTYWLLAIFFVGCSKDTQLPKVILDSDFDVDRKVLLKGEQGAFQANGVGQPTSWSWVFEGGNPSTSSEQNPVVTYNEPGKYSVELTISKDQETSTEKKDNFVNVVSIFEGEHPRARPCKLDNVFPFDYVGLGFPNKGPAPSLGTVNVQVLFADFTDARALKTTQSVFEILDPINKDFFDEMSYGKMKVNLIPHHKWLNLTNNSTHYAQGMRSGAGHLAFIQEAVDLADEEVNFGSADIVLVVSNPDADRIGFGPAFGSLSEDFAIKADGNNIRAGVTSGFDLNNWGGIWLAHEMGHNLGLSDLYGFDGDSHRHVGGFDIMGLISGDAPGFFAYERWLLGWLDDAQVFCHSSGSVTIEIQEIETEGGLKAVLVPFSDTEALVIESRRKKGFDSSLQKEGVLVYVVDVSKERGTGPIVVKPGVDSGAMKANAPMETGDVYTYRNVDVEVIDSRSTSDIITVNVR